MKEGDGHVISISKFHSWQYSGDHMLYEESAACKVLRSHSGCRNSCSVRFASALIIVYTEKNKKEMYHCTFQSDSLLTQILDGKNITYMIYLLVGSIGATQWYS